MKKFNYREHYLLNVGKIHDGYAIHHIDHNCENNNINNLISIPLKLHTKYHSYYRLLKINTKLDTIIDRNYKYINKLRECVIKINTYVIVKNNNLKERNK